MISFLWKATNNNNELISGEIKTLNKHTAIEKLQNQGLFILKIKKKPKSIFSLTKKKISIKKITDFSRQFATLISSNIPLITALNILEKSYKHTGMQQLIQKLIQNIESGHTLAEAMQNHPKYFDTLFCNLLQAGENSGTLDVMLNYIANYKEKTIALKSKVKKALFYPCTVLIIAIVVTTILMVFVIPQFQSLFQGFGANLPSFTRFILRASNIVKNYALYILAIIFTLIISIKILKKRSKSCAYYFDKAVLKLPIVGSIYQKAIIARLCYTLAITFKASMPLDNALAAAANTAGNLVYYQSIKDILEQVKNGQAINKAMQTSNLFPHRCIQLIAIGEESGTLDTMLSRIACYYEEEVNLAVTNLNNLLEPLIMVILSIVVGGLIAGMYLPIFRLGAVI